MELEKKIAKLERLTNKKVQESEDSSDDNRIQKRLRQLSSSKKSKKHRPPTESSDDEYFENRIKYLNELHQKNQHEIKCMRDEQFVAQFDSRL